MENEILSKVYLLISQKKYDVAERYLGPFLAQNPNDEYALYYMAILLLHKGERYDEALRLIDTAITQNPTESDYFSLKAQIYNDLDKYDLCEENIKIAINLDPNSSYDFALWGQVKLIRKKYEEALELANHALTLDASQILALNVRSSALIKLNKKEESFDTIATALQDDPNNPYTHANYGWGLLESQKPEEALMHFKEALKQDPNLEFAKHGMIEAMKAKYWVYRKFLQFSFWIGNKSSQMQWVIILAFFFSGRILNFISEQIPVLTPIVIPIIVLLGIFALSTWLIKPLSNSFLRMHKTAKYALTSGEIFSSNLFLICLVGFLLSGIFIFIKGDPIFYGTLIFSFCMMVPVGTLGNQTSKKLWLVTYTIIMALIGLLALYHIYQTNALEGQMSIIFFYVFIGFQFLYNFISIKEDNA